MEWLRFGEREIQRQITKGEDPHPYFCSNKQNKNNLFDCQVWVKSRLSHGGKEFTLPLVNVTISLY